MAGKGVREHSFSLKWRIHLMKHPLDVGQRSWLGRQRFLVFAQMISITGTFNLVKGFRVAWDWRRWVFWNNTCFPAFTLFDLHTLVVWRLEMAFVCLSASVEGYAVRNCGFDVIRVSRWIDCVDVDVEIRSIYGVRGTDARIWCRRSCICKNTLFIDFSKSNLSQLASNSIHNSHRNYAYERERMLLIIKFLCSLRMRDAFWRTCHANLSNIRETLLWQCMNWNALIINYRFFQRLF